MIATDLLFPRFASDFCLLTTIWDEPKAFDAGRFSADMMSVVSLLLLQILAEILATAE